MTDKTFEEAKWIKPIRRIGDSNGIIFSASDMALNKMKRGDELDLSKVKILKKVNGDADGRDVQ